MCSPQRVLVSEPSKKATGNRSERVDPPAGRESSVRWFGFGCAISRRRHHGASIFCSKGPDEEAASLPPSLIRVKKRICMCSDEELPL